MVLVSGLSRHSNGFSRGPDEGRHKGCLNIPDVIPQLISCTKPACKQRWEGFSKKVALGTDDRDLLEVPGDYGGEVSSRDYIFQNALVVHIFSVALLVPDMKMTGWLSCSS